MKQSDGTTMGVRIAIGTAFGVGMGLAMDNIGAGIAIGSGIGVALGAAMMQRGKDGERRPETS